MVIPFFKDTLSGQCLVTLAALFVALLAGSFYAWAAYSTDLRDNFGWTLAQATSVNTAGILGYNLLAIFMAMILNSYGPIMALTYSTVLLSGSFFMLHRLAAGGSSSVLLASLLYACNGNGSFGFYVSALFSVTTCWPVTLVGTGVAVMDVAFSMGSVFVAKAYPLLASITTYYMIMSSLALVVGITLILCHINWTVLIWGADTGKKSELVEWDSDDDESDFEDTLMLACAVSGAASVPVAPRGRHARASTYDPTQSTDHPADVESDADRSTEFHKLRSTVVADRIVNRRVTDSDISQIFGLLPSKDELKAKYNKMPMADALSTPEFLISGTFSMFCFTTTALLSAQLATVKLQMGVDLDVSTLLTTFMVTSAFGKFGGGAMSDATVHTKYFCRQFYMLAANAVIFLSFSILAFMPQTETLFLVVLGALGFARGAGSVIFTTVLKESFGARMLGVFMSGVYFLFFFGYASWGTLFVMCSDGAVPIGFWKFVSAGCMVPLAVSGHAWHQQVQSK